MNQIDSESDHNFICVKCNSKRQIQELSSDHRVCKDCKSLYNIIKCHYCRSEFYVDKKNKRPSSICKKCEQLMQEHGKPRSCSCCKIVAAYIGTKCQRCTNSEKKYGKPLTCETCKQKSAFDRKDPEGNKKVDGKLLCWLCTMAYKRSIAKAKLREAVHKSENKHQSNGNHRHSHGYSSSTSASKDSSKKRKLEGQLNGYQTSLSSTLPIATLESRFTESMSNDFALMVTQLKEEVAQLNKRLQMKDKELLTKDQLVSILSHFSNLIRQIFRTF